MESLDNKQYRDNYNHTTVFFLHLVLHFTYLFSDAQTDCNEEGSYTDQE